MLLRALLAPDGLALAGFSSAKGPGRVRTGEPIIGAEKGGYGSVKVYLRLRDAVACFDLTATPRQTGARR